MDLTQGSQKTLKTFLEENHASRVVLFIPNTGLTKDLISGNFIVSSEKKNPTQMSDLTIMGPISPAVPERTQFKLFEEFHTIALEDILGVDISVEISRTANIFFKDISENVPMFGEMGKTYFLVRNHIFGFSGGNGQDENIPLGIGIRRLSCIIMPSGCDGEKTIFRENGSSPIPACYFGLTDSATFSHMAFKIKDQSKIIRSLRSSASRRRSKCKYNFRGNSLTGNTFK